MSRVRPGGEPSAAGRMVEHGDTVVDDVLTPTLSVPEPEFVTFRRIEIPAGRRTVVHPLPDPGPTPECQVEATCRPRRRCALGSRGRRVEIEVHPLALAQHSEDRTFERVGGEQILGAAAVGVDEHALTGVGVEAAERPPACQGFWTLPALMHEVHTCRRRGDPSTTARTFWMFGFQRRLVRRWE